MYIISSTATSDIVQNIACSHEELPILCWAHYFPTFLYSSMEPKEVNKTPPTIDRMKLDKVKTTSDKWHEDNSDLRYFEMNTCFHQDLFGVCKIGYCHGSWICKNPNCTFLETSTDGQPNRVNFKRPRVKSEKICNICDHCAEREGCSARKFVEFHPNKE